MYDSNVDVLGTVDDSLYNCERYGQSTYNIPVPSGKEAWPNQSMFAAATFIR
jgi:hypothetical protein